MVEMRLQTQEFYWAATFTSVVRDTRRALGEGISVIRPQAAEIQRVEKPECRGSLEEAGRALIKFKVLIIMN